MIQVCDLSFANSSITDTLGNYSLVSSGTVTISGVDFPTNTDPILYVTDSSYSCIEFGQTTTYSNGAIIQAGIPDYGSENWAMEFRARVTGAMPGYYGNYVIFYGCRAPYDDNGTIRMGGHWSISISNSLDALEFAYVDHYDILTIKGNLDFTAWHLYKVTKTAGEILTLHIDGVLVATIDLEQQIGYKTHATLGSFVLLGDADWNPTVNSIQTDQAVRLADVKVYADPMGHAEKAISLDNLSRVFRNYNTWLSSQLSGQIGDGTLTIQKNGTNVATFTANQSTAATANITVPVNTSDLVNDSGYLTASSNLDASKLTSGTVDIARLPQGALERLVKVANEAARYALTTADVQLGDTVQQLDTGIMYIVTDTDHLDSAAGYTEYTAGTAASVPWSGVTGKPTFAAVATSGAYSDLTGTPTIPTVNNATLTIQKNGANVQTFTANQSTNATANIIVPTKTSDLTNDSGFITEDNTKIPLAGSNQISGDLIPSTNGTVNLGGSSYQWNNLYAKSYYYNGTQWGLDQANVWTGRQTYDAYLKSFGEARTDDWSSNSRTNAYLLSRRDTDDVSGFLINTFRSNVAQGTAMHIYGWDILENSTRYSGLRFTIDWDSGLNSGNGAYKVTLGTNTQGTNPCNDLHITQLKTINGINPGALSLPGTSVNVDTTNWVLDGSNVNSFTPASDGWLGIQVTDTVYDQMHYVFVGRIGGGSTYYQQNISSPINALWDSKYHGCVFIPVIKNMSYHIRCICDNIVARFYPCQGNV